MNDIDKNGTDRRKERGQSLVELSLLAPLLLIALYIPADFGVAFFMGNLTQNAAREGARIGSELGKTGGTSTDLDYSSAEANTVRDEVRDRMPDFLKSRKVIVKFYEGSNCMEFIEVTAQGDYNFFLYQLLHLFGGDTPDAVTISRTTQMRYNHQTADQGTRCTATTVDVTYDLADA